MKLPLNLQSNKPPLELRSIKLYSTGAKGKVFTKLFYKSMNHNFGIEITVKNNTSQLQTIFVAGCIYNEKGVTVIRWKKSLTKIKPNTHITRDFYVREESFSKMKEGNYKIQFWINNKKVQKEFFKITYK